MRKDFDKIEISKWFDGYTCQWCGKNHASAYHHILGGSNSLLNCSQLENHGCHIEIHHSLRKKENVKRLLLATLELLVRQGYVYTINDMQFISDNQDYYEEIILDVENESRKTLNELSKINEIRQEPHDNQR